MKKYSIIYGTLVFIVFLFLILGKVRVLGQIFLEKPVNPKITHGDMYAMAEIEKFKGYITLFDSPENTNITEAEIYTIGDSFFQVSQESQNFANELEKIVKRPVYNVAQESPDFLKVANPLLFIKQQKIQTGKPKIIILESTDWRSLPRAKNYPQTSARENKIINFLTRRIFKNGDVEYFVRNNFVAAPARRKLKNWLFERFGDVDPRIGAFDEKTKMAFYFEEVNFSKREKSEAEINKAADGIEQLAKILKEQYNINLLYLNMPDKFAFYGQTAEPEFKYDNFAARLQKQLADRKINSLDVYEIFKDYQKQHPEDLLYYPSDSHYTALGESLVVKAAVVQINKIFDH